MAGARSVAAKVLARVEREGAFAAAVLEAEAAGLTDPREAAMATELVLGVLRRRPWLDGLIESASSRGTDGLDPAVRQVLRVAVYQLAFLERVPARAAVNEAVETVRAMKKDRMAGFVNGLLRNLARRDEAALLPPPVTDVDDAAAVALCLPSWFLETLAKERGDEAALRTAEAFNRPSRRTLRVNTRRATPKEILARLGDLGGPGRHLPWYVEVDGRDAARALEEEGLATYQDEGAGLIAVAVDPRPGQRVLDACAGRGGKTGAMADLAEDLSITATDRKASKLQRLSFELGRQGLEVATRATDLAAGADGLGDGYDRVLLDAPCTGTGTMGRRPEIRWKLGQKDVAALAKIQRAMLDNLCPLVAPGGRLVFAVCSVLEAEGADQRRAFLERHPEFAPTEDRPREWPDTVPWEDGAAFIDPGLTGTDGYYLFSVEKRG